MADSDSMASFGIGLLLGAAVGTAIGMLYAPQSGAETRALLKEKAAETKTKAEEILEEARERAKKIIADAKGEAAAIESKK